MGVLRPLRKFLQRSRLKYSLSFRWLEQLIFLNEKETFLIKALQFIKHNNIAGDYLEFGVFEGNTTASVYHCCRILDMRSIRLFAFDSFAGLPAAIGDDKKYNDFQEGTFSCDEEHFLDNCKTNGVDLAHIKTVKGWFKDSLSRATRDSIGLKQAGLVYIDCDLYESAVHVLNFITDLLQDGSIIAFDDWFCFAGRPDFGEQRAFREWQQRNPQFSFVEFQRYNWHGLSFIVNRRGAS